MTGGLKPFSSTDVHLPGRHVVFGAVVGGDESEAYVGSHAMTKEDIRNVVRQFANAARLAVEVAGFDGVEIHGANGYLLDTFVHDNINTREDEYGGSLENRLRFPLEVVDAVVGAVGRERTAIRLAPFHNLQETNDSDRLRTFSVYAEKLEERGLAYVHMVERRYDQFSKEGAFSGSIQRKGGDEGTAQRGETLDDRSLWRFRKILKNTVLVGAGGYDGTSAAQAVEEGLIDVAAFGRYFTSNPDLPDRLFRGLPLTKYHRPTFYTSDSEGYIGWSRYED
ncbi:hypothetical protein BJY04DRAFT_179600 [Aspergillus karnatakaensis]|uniref:uncharacterized protein n=1 Tax=Aspergillus karnatakaensis TaxID=1810916 RepID=UPI003CCDCF3A